MFPLIRFFSKEKVFQSSEEAIRKGLEVSINSLFPERKRLPGRRPTVSAFYSTFLWHGK